MNCIIVDDDKMARLALRQLISNVDCLKLKEECADATEAFNYLKKEVIDLIFLDVEMPGMSGIELIKNLVKRPIIILITSKKDYAVEAFELNVADYIIKPVSPERFSVAVAKAKELFDAKDMVIDNDEKYKEYIFVRSNSILTKIKLNDIIYITVSGDYVNIITPNKRYTVQCTLERIEEKLSPNKFYRLNNSFLVAKDHIDSVRENTTNSIKPVLPIDEHYKMEFLRKLSRI